MATLHTDAIQLFQTDEFCYRHPEQETGLHCTQCGRAICVRCVVPAAVGQVCHECARSRRPANYQLSFGTFVVALPIAGILSLILSVCALALIAPLPIYAIYFLVGGSVAAARQVVHLLDRLTRAKRGKTYQIAVGTVMGLAALPVVLAALVFVTPMDAVLLLIFVMALIFSTMMSLR